MRLDQETTQVLTDGEALKKMVETEGWQIAKRRLGDKMSEFVSLTTLELQGRNAEEVVAEISNRLAVKDIIYSWISDIQGEVEKFESNKTLFKDDNSDGLVSRH